MPRIDFDPLAPVKLIKPNGQVFPYGVGATSNSARGTALKNAVDAATANDIVEFISGQYDVSQPLILDVDGMTLRGPGRGAILRFTCGIVNGSSIVIRTYADGLKLRGFCVKSEGSGGQQGIGYNTTATDYPVGFIGATNFIFEDLEIHAQRDAIQFFDSDTLVTGLIKDVSIFQRGTPGDLMVDIEQADGSAIDFINLAVEADNDAAFHWAGSGNGVARLFGGCRFSGSTDFHIVQDAGTVYVDATVDYDPAKVSGTVTPLPAFGTTPTNAGLAALGGDGSELTSLNASNLSSGTINGARLGNYAKRIATILIPGTLATGDGQAPALRIPIEWNGWNLVGVAACVKTPSSSGLPTFQIRRVRSATAADMLTTKITLDVSEVDSSTAATPAVIDTANDDVATGDQIYVDCDVAGTGTTDSTVQLVFQLP